MLATVPHGHWKTLTFLAGLRSDRIVAPCVIDGPINGELFVLYIEKVLAPTLSAGDVVVLDPPRNGLAKGVVEAMVRRAPRRITYVSCDAATFARDLKAFVAAGYEMADMRVFDLFPMTEHVEIVATLDIGA